MSGYSIKTDSLHSLYEVLPGLVLGFHGCDISTAKAVINDRRMLEKSTNSYDWLGNGIYFWENDYERALEWANEGVSHGSIKEPAVIGAVISYGKCLNLLDYSSNSYLQAGFELLKLRSEQLGVKLPQNHGKRGNDILLRDRDCFVIEEIQRFLANKGIQPFDSVRGIFIEGAPAFEGSGIYNKTHVQISVVNPNCIKGFFWPRNPDNDYPIP